MNTGLDRIWPDHRDYHFLKSFGITSYDIAGLPADFSIYDGRTIPDQNEADTRFTPAIKALTYGCTAEAGSFACGLEDGLLYNPEFTYIMTPPGTEDTGRDLRAMLKELKLHGLMDDQGRIGYMRTGFFNVYAAGAIDDFDAARIALYLNQEEKRSVIIGTAWYPEFESPSIEGALPVPLFNMKFGTEHCYIATGWKSFHGDPYLEIISWQGQTYGVNGIVYMSRAIYNALINQPYAAAFTVTKATGIQPVTIGMQAYIDHFVAFFLHLFNLDQKKT